MNIDKVINIVNEYAMFSHVRVAIMTFMSDSDNAAAATQCYGCILAHLRMPMPKKGVGGGGGAKQSLCLSVSALIV